MGNEGDFGGSGVGENSQHETAKAGAIVTVVGPGGKIHNFSIID